MFKKFVLFLTAAAVLIFSGAAFAEGNSRLPEIKGWVNGQLRTTELATISGNKGSWLERNYRTNSGSPLRAIWVDGAAAKGWLPSAEISRGGEISGGETAKNVMIGAQKAVLEYRPAVGFSLIISLKDGVLTLESMTAEEKDMLNAAETLLNNIK